MYFVSVEDAVSEGTIF